MGRVIAIPKAGKDPRLASNRSSSGSAADTLQCSSWREFCTTWPPNKTGGAAPLESFSAKLLRNSRGRDPPCLCAMCTDDIPTLAGQLQDWEEDVVLALYADDSAYLVSSRWPTSLWLNFSGPSTYCQTGWTNSLSPVRYLGVQIDRSMRMAAQVEHVIHQNRAARGACCVQFSDRTYRSEPKLPCMRATSVSGSHTRLQHGTHSSSHRKGRGSKVHQASKANSAKLKKKTL
ncbi:hypothetical protein EVAR_50896_1 [Eumeta japonica]|uniref:Uncharacterized protein n=1 Tax=Eumeta variegata TaxID=151549 RepID=A0A4C1YC96_EUMVA|nr:hypothetical protein EVAR_50896_1 [Eumeta japonica]